MCWSRYWCYMSKARAGHDLLVLNGFLLLAVGGDEVGETIEEYTVKEEMMELIDQDCAFVMMKYYLKQIYVI